MTGALFTVCTAVSPAPETSPEPLGSDGAGALGADGAETLGGAGAGWVTPPVGNVPDDDPDPLDGLVFPPLPGTLGAVICCGTAVGAATTRVGCTWTIRVGGATIAVGRIGDTCV